MTRLFGGLVLASFSIVASAADKPLPVTVTNPVLPVEVSNADPLAVTLTTQAVNAHVTGAMPAYTVARDVYVNDGDKPVMFTALSVSLFGFSIGCSPPAKPARASFFVANSAGGLSTNTFSMQFGEGTSVYLANCLWTVYVAGNVVIGPGQVLRASAELNNLTDSPSDFSYGMSASGHSLP